MITFPRNYLHVFCLAIIALTGLPFLIDFNSAQILVHDSIDSNWIWYKILTESVHFVGANNHVIIALPMGGLPRYCAPSETQLFLWLIYFFGVKGGFVLTYFLVHSLAYLGMYLLGKRVIGQSHLLVHLISLAFGLLPFWIPGFLSVAGIPLIAFALLSLHKGYKSYLYWAILILIPLCTFFPLSGLFTIPAFGVWLLVVSLLQRKLTHAWLGFICFICFTLMADWRLLTALFINHAETQREILYALEGTLNWKGWAGVSTRHWLFGQYHNHSFPFLIFPWILFVAFINKNSRKTLVLGMFILLFMSVLRVMPEVKGMAYIIRQIPLIKGLTFRFEVLQPLMVYVLWLISISYILLEERKIFSKWAMAYAIFIHTALLFFIGRLPDYQGSKYIEQPFFQTYIERRNTETTTWNSYYFQGDSFSSYFDQSSRYLCLGFDDERIQYQGIKTYGGYWNLYPLAFHHWFNHLRKDTTLPPITRRCYHPVKMIGRQQDTISPENLDAEKCIKAGISKVITLRPLKWDHIQLQAHWKTAQTPFYLYRLEKDFRNHH